MLEGLTRTRLRHGDRARAPRRPACARVGRACRPALRLLLAGLLLAGAGVERLRAEEGLAPAAPPRPDRVVLDNEQRFEGVIVDEDPSQVTLEVSTAGTGGLGRIRIPRSRIRRIERGDGTPEAPPALVTVREAWFVLYSGGQPVGTRHEVLRSLRVDGQSGFRLEETVVQLAQGQRIPRARYERVEDTDARFLPRRLQWRELREPEAEGPEADSLAPVPRGLQAWERAVTGRVEQGTWRSSWRRGTEEGAGQQPLPGEVWGVLGLRERLLREPRVPGVQRLRVLDVAQDALVDVEAGFASVQPGEGGVDELHWRQERAQRVTRYRGLSVLEDRVDEGVVAVGATPAQARAVEALGRGASVPAAVREVPLVEAGLRLVLPPGDWVATRPVASGLDSGRRVVARLASALLVADVRVEWDPEGARAHAGPDAQQAALLERLREVCPDLRLLGPRREARQLPGAWRLSLGGTLRETPVRTEVLVAPWGEGVVYCLAALPEASWEAGRQALEDVLASLRPL